MSVRELKHERLKSGRFSKFRGLSATVSFLSFPPLPALLFAPFVPRSLTLVPRSVAPKPHRNACYAGYFDVRGSELTPSRDKLFTVRYKGVANIIRTIIFI